MKLSRSRTGIFPDNTSIRWVVDEHNHYKIVGMIGTVKDLTAANMVRLKRGCPWYPDRWLAVPVSDTEPIEERSTREEAFAVFKEDRNG